MSGFFSQDKKFIKPIEMIK